MNKIILSLIALPGLMLSCAVTDQVAEHANIVNVQFESKGMGVSLVIAGLGKRAASSLAGDSVIFKWNIKATNPNKDPAVFDGGDMFLRVDDTSKSATPLTSKVPGFKVLGDSAAQFAIAFPVSLEHWPLSPDILKRVIDGTKIPYKSNADLFFRLIGSTGFASDTLGSDTIRMDLATDSIATRPDSNQVKMILALINSTN